MTNNRSSTNPVAADFPALLHANFQQLNNLPIFDIDFLDKDKDWYLLSFLREQKRNGHSFEISFAALNAIVGALADDSYFRSPTNNKIGFLNQNHHIIGESASNKSSICQEISLSLQTVMKLFPGRYSSSTENLEGEYDDSNMKKMKKKSNTEAYSMVVSNVTEVGLLNNLAKVNTILVHSDGDVALNKFGYYEQGRNDTAAGVSLFCDASDGIFEGFIRGTGVSQMKIERPVALLNMFIASTGTKLAHMLQRFHETKDQDGVYGRVFFTWCQAVPELPKPKTICFTNIASFTHFAYAVAQFFTNKFQFRHQANKSDVVRKITEIMHDEERLIQELKKQKVTTPAAYSFGFDTNVIETADAIDTNDNEEQISSFKLLQMLLGDWWKASNSAEHHLKSIRRKVVNILSKSIWCIKIIRIIFQLMGNNLHTIDQRQGDRTTSNSTCIDTAFQRAIQTSINDYLSTKCQQIENYEYVMWSNKNDIITGYIWYSRKMLVLETLFTHKLLPDIIAERTGRKTIEKSGDEIKLENAMFKVMNFSVVFFTRQYLTSKKSGEGSGQFSHAYDLKPDQILAPLVEQGLLIGGNFIKNARNGPESFKHSSFCKQLPSVIQNNSRIKKAFDELGLDMANYETTFAHQRLPLGMVFNDNAIEFMKTQDEFVPYYHNYYKEEIIFKSFREMVDERVRLGQIVRHEDEIYSSHPIIASSNSKTYFFDENLFEMSNTSSENIMVTTNIAATTDSVETSEKLIGECSIENINSNPRVQTIDQEVIDVACQQQHTSANHNKQPSKQCVQVLSNLNEDSVLNVPLSLLHDNPYSFHCNNTNKSPAKDSSDNIFINCTQNSELEHFDSLPETVQLQNQHFTKHISSPQSIIHTKTASTITIDVPLSTAEPMEINATVLNNTENEADIRSSTNETISLHNNVLKNITNHIETNLSDETFDDQQIQNKKKRGRPNFVNTTSQKLSFEEVNNMIINPKSSNIWKSILIKRNFILGTSTDIFKMIPSKLFDEEARLKLIDFLLLKKLLVRGDWFCDVKGSPITGYMKGSPADPEVSLSLGHFGLDIEEYKLSINPNKNNKLIIDGRMVNKSFSYSVLLQQRIQNDDWFKDQLEINERFIYVTNEELVHTTSNHQIDQFQQQQKDKAYRAMTNKRKHVEELQKQTLLICGTDIPSKRKRKPKIRED